MKKILISLVFVGMMAGTSFAVPFSYDGLGLPSAITDYNWTTSFTITDNPGIITDLNVYVDLDHTWMGDLDIYLTHGATTIQLYDQNGGSGDDMTQVTFDDEASVSIADASAPYGPGSFQAVDLLSSFDGMALTGAWILTIYDNWSADQGTLYGFGISGDAAAPVPEPGTLLLLGGGLVGLFYLRSRKKA